MREVDKVASNFSGLNLEFEYKPREVNDRNAENARVAEDLREQRHFRDRAVEISAAKQQLHLHRNKQEHIELVKRRLRRLQDKQNAMELQDQQNAMELRRQDTH